MSTRAIVKSVLSGDTVIVRSKDAPEQVKPSKERVLHIAGISAPRLGSMSREDEPQSFSSREYLRALLVGKEIALAITHTLDNKSGLGGSDREFANILIAPAGPGQPPQDVASLIVSNGWAKLRDGVGEGEEAVRRLGAEEAKRREGLRAAESQAQSEGKGIWAGEPENQRTVSFQMPTDPHAFIAEHKGKDIDAIVEQVRDGTQLRVRLLLDQHTHQFVNLVVAGAKSPRASNARDGDTSNAEPFGEEAKFFTEVRLLQRHIKVRLLSAPASLGASPFQSGPTPAAASAVKPTALNGSGLPAPTTGGASVVIGTAMHPNGNIAEFLTGAGLAKVIDWHAGILAQNGGLDRLRAAERSAKEKKLGLWEGYGATKGPSGTATNGTVNGSTSTKGSSFDAVVVRVWNSDQISVVVKGDESGKERRLQFASVRGPKGTEGKQAYWANEAKEFLRKRLIGKTVHIHVDYVKPKEGEYDERECVTVTYGASNNNVAEQLIEKGLATVLRHKRDDEDRSMELDKLVVAEQTAVAETQGVHSTKDVSLARIVDASESASRASQYLPSWKRGGRHQAVVDFVSSGSRFKLFMPKENTKITFVLAGIRTPRTARSANEKSEPFGPESMKFASKYMQRDVEIAFDSTDKQGGFIGAVYLNGVNVATELVREGFASVHTYSAESLPFGRELMTAEEEAKSARKNLWSDYTGEEVQTTTAEGKSSALPATYIDVYVSAVRDTDPFGFSVQILSDASVASLEKLMSDFSLHHRQSTTNAPADFSPKTGDLVSAKFTEDNQWYRAKVKKSSAVKKEAVLYFIDYGNEETLLFSRIRPLDTKFKSLPGQVTEARLSFVKLVGKSSEYGPEAWRRFGALTEGRKLVANVDQREGSTLHLRLIDPTDPNAADDPLACLNADLVREGLATVDKSCRYLAAYPQILEKLQSATEGAKRDRLGIFEFGDVSED